MINSGMSSTQMIAPTIYDPNDIAKFFLAQQDEDAGDLISNLKLQKLCYYAQGLAMATRGVPMFNEPVEAWLHGPVVPCLYREYRSYGSAPIPAPTGFDIEAINPADRMILEDVHTFYGQFSAWRLRQMTHEESPWRDAYEADANHVISQDALLAHFAGEIDDAYRAKYGEISGR
ncbi:Panacea domain-containing protein [Sphingomonas sp. Leaf205]|uniref:Panacea domain-containing protein n=1 Tax=Sphingomonas sp. Leaf205 TaxID=2876551 RepID=UPI001E3801D2|nr:type II toxin-antitoxin system antitoxin SocA domain-containing protein [Sphingomonas sp. Leaf205]